jgi:predicted transcriptional regulator
MKPYRCGDAMEKRNISRFSKKDEEFVKVLVSIGTKRNVARVLVFLLDRIETTMREIERGPTSPSRR